MSRHKSMNPDDNVVLVHKIATGTYTPHDMAIVTMLGLGFWLVMIGLCIYVVYTSTE